MTRHVVETHTGLLFDYSDPKPEQVCVEDIAHSLSNVCRFAGHVNRHYSVAQHALLVRRLVCEAGHPELAMAALHHDSHEAYIGDVPTPLKLCLGEGYRLICDRVDAAVAEALGIDGEDLESKPVRDADQLAMRIEATALKCNGGRTFAAACGYDEIPDVPWDFVATLTPEMVEQLFMHAHRREASVVWAAA